MFSLLRKNKDNLFLIWFLVFIIAESLSWLCFNFDWCNIVVLGLVAVITAILSLKRPIFALYLPLAELFWGSVGHCFMYGVWNLRLVIFLVIIVIFFSKNIFKLKYLKIVQDKSIFIIWFFMLFLVGLGIWSAYYQEVDLIKIFFDANAYGYLLYFPVWYEIYDRKYIKGIVNLLQAAALAVAIKTLIIFNFFVQGYGLDNIVVYKWIRDTRTGEITPFANNFYRVFLKSQIYLVVAWLLSFISQLKDVRNYKNLIYLGIILAALIVSLSRSFWLGGLVALLFLIINLFIYLGKKFLLPTFFILLTTSLIGILTVQVFFNIPHFNSVNIFTQRTTALSEPAANSRLQLLGPLWSGVKEHLFLGHGFAKDITYQSADPKIKNEFNPEGWYTTHAFEWGWLDQWLKLGLVFIVCLIAWILLVYIRSYVLVKENVMIALTIASLVTALSWIHIFTPYLNHPLGLGLLMLCTIIVSRYNEKNQSYY